MERRYIKSSFKLSFRNFRQVGVKYHPDMLNFKIDVCDFIRKKPFGLNFGIFIMGIIQKFGFNIHQCPYKVKIHLKWFISLIKSFLGKWKLGHRKFLPRSENLWNNGTSNASWKVQVCEIMKTLGFKWQNF